MYRFIYVFLHPCIYVSMHLCIYAPTYLCTYVSMYLCIYASLHLCIYVSLHLCIYVSIYVSMFLCMFVATYVCTFVSTYVCTFVSMYVCMFFLYVGMLVCFRPLAFFKSFLQAFLAFDAFSFLWCGSTCTVESCNPSPWVLDLKVEKGLISQVWLEKTRSKMLTRAEVLNDIDMLV